MANHKHIAKSGDTFDTLAKQYFNDNSIAKMLASFNKMDSAVALADATEVNIPMRLHVLEKTTSENGTPVAHLKVVRANINVVQKGDSGDIVEEINIRLSGFGGGVPNSTFDDVTELKVKQFQKDYMKIDTPTGKVDEETAKAIDEFGSKYDIPLNSLKCNCHKCGGFGEGRHKDEYFEKNDRNGKPKPHSEATYRYEYPGMHRSLLWGLRGLTFHLGNDSPVFSKFDFFSSGYRCNDHPLTVNRKTVNHMGKAADIHFLIKAGDSFITPTNDNEDNSNCEKIRKLCLKTSVLSAQMEWGSSNRFSLESTVDGAKTWVHVDVRMFDKKYLNDRFFCKTVQDLNGKSLIDLLKEKS
jgi:Putative peptidoglycan binding domain